MLCNRESLHFKLDITQPEPFIINLFLMRKGNNYKLARSRNPRKRIEELSVTESTDLKLVACCPMMNGAEILIYEILGISLNDWVELDDKQVSDIMELMRSYYYKYKYTKYPILVDENQTATPDIDTNIPIVNYRYKLDGRTFRLQPDANTMNDCIGKNGTFLKGCNVKNLSDILYGLGVRTNIDPRSR